jgi:ubiquinone/menaquinone biosynthesis C-methylase UbiE
MLDVGCGPDPRGDVNCDLIKSNNVHSIPNFVQCSALNLPFTDKCFDTTISCHVIEHVPDPFVMFKELMRVSSKELIIRCPHKDGSGAHVPGHVSFFDFDWFFNEAKKYNIECKCQITYYDSVIPISPRRFIPKKLSSNILIKSFLSFFRTFTNPNHIIKNSVRAPFEIEAKFATQLDAI